MGVSPFTLGLFAPLPLAMMIPFMATQSLAMGEAFGKSFQFGKRKISSMSNEEFNKLTIKDLMNEQTANIRTLIPALAQQMNDSNIMQEKVFKEMTKLLPAFIKGLSSGTKEIIEDNKLDLSNVLPAPGGAAQIVGEQIVRIIIETQGNNTQSNNTQGNRTQEWYEVAAEEYVLPPPGSQTFTQEEQDIQDNPPSNVPITVSSLTDKELRDAYSDSLSNRLGLTPKQKQQLTLEYKKRFRNKPPANLGKVISTGVNTANTDSANYQNQKTTLMQEVLRIKRLIAIGHTATGSRKAIANSALPKRKAFLSAAQKLVINLITKYRNIPSTKAMANSDWNARIWK